MFRSGVRNDWSGTVPAVCYYHAYVHAGIDMQHGNGTRWAGWGEAGINLTRFGGVDGARLGRGLRSSLSNQEEGTSSGDGRRQAKTNSRTFGPTLDKPRDDRRNRKDSLDRRGENGEKKRKSKGPRANLDG